MPCYPTLSYTNVENHKHRFLSVGYHMLQSYEMEFDKFLKRQNKSVYISVNAFLEKSFL
nr:MAG TPA: hypothetical protein [Caudoviricetes sp.]